MKVMFFSFHNKFEAEIHPGIAVLSAVLKSEGHDVKLQPYFYYDENCFKQAVSSYKPDLIGLSATHMAVEQVKKLSVLLKRITDVPVILGGVFPILEPQKAIAIENIDAICIGDGCKGIVEFLNGQHPATNFVYKNMERGRVQTYSEAPLPMLDYDVFWDGFDIKGDYPAKLDYWTSFTCEFGCAFCCNMKLRKLTGQKNKPRHDIACLINNIKELSKSYKSKKIQFRDPLFIGPEDISWINEFLPIYAREIGLPYSANIRADVLDENLAKLLSETGCYLLKMGLESGSEELRNKVLHKGETDEQFRKACRAAHKAGIRVSLNAMLGIPYENVETAKKTVSFMKELEPDKTFLHLFQPWPGLCLDQEIEKYIKYLKFPALNDSVVSGRKFKKDINAIDTNIRNEFVLTPVLDQPAFSYKQALEIQQKFHEGMS